MSNIIFVGLFGGPRTGKTTTLENLVSFFGKTSAIIHGDHFCHPKAVREARGINSFDVVEAYDVVLFLSKINDLKQGKLVRLPVWDYQSGDRVSLEGTILDPETLRFVFVDWFLLPQIKDIKSHVDMLLATKTSTEEIMRERKFQIDCLPPEQGGRGYDIEFVKKQWVEQTLPGFKKLVEPFIKEMPDDEVLVNDNMNVNPFNQGDQRITEAAGKILSLLNQRFSIQVEEFCLTIS